MKAHNLLQAIARVNRIYDENKTCGFVVDYVGVGHHLKHALADYDEREQKEILSGLSEMHSCRIIRFPLVSRSFRSVENKLRRLTMNDENFGSSVFLDIWDNNIRSRVTTCSDASERVFRSAGNVPSLMSSFLPAGALRCSIMSQLRAATRVASWSLRNWRVSALTVASQSKFGIFLDSAPKSCTSPLAGCPGSPTFERSA